MTVTTGEIAMLFGWVGMVLGFALMVPQAWTTIVHRRTAGLSWAWLWIALGSNGGWLVYGLQGGGVVQVAAAVSGIAIEAAILVSLLRQVPQARRSAPYWLAVACAWGPLVWAAGAWGGFAVVGALCAATSYPKMLPQLWRIVRNPQESTEGVSAATQWTGMACTFSWLVYAGLRNEMALIVSSAPYWLAGGLILLALRRRRLAERHAVVLHLPMQRQPEVDPVRIAA